MVTLGMLLERLDVETVKGDCRPEVPVERITSDSRQVAKGALFTAVRGHVTDGHRFIGDAVAGGAGAVVCEALPEDSGGGCPFIVVQDSRKAMAQIAKAFYRDTSDRLQIIGVTGTNGKTTTARLMAAMMSGCGIATGYIGTGLALAGEETIPLERTTPEAEELHRLFYMMAERGCKAVVMEVSSHALVLLRTYGIVFTGAVFTNLTQDHLDFHHTMEKYAAAKQMLFSAVAPEGYVVVNADDPWAGFMAGNRGSARLYCCTVGDKQFACKEGEEVRAKVVEADMQRTRVEVSIKGRSCEGVFKLLGLYNVMNLLEVFASGVAMGLEPANVIRRLSWLSPVEGRMEIIRDTTGDFCAVVDYAHTPDALEKVIGELNNLKPEGAALAVVFGCGGNRDREKRSKMGEIAAKKADRVIITSDNPRDENPESILDHIAEGLASASYMRFGDRAEAIRCGVNLLKKGDMLLVAGKGHETYQESAGARRYFSDREIARKALLARSSNCKGRTNECR